MTESYDKIISEYRNADFYRRLSMYLQFRQLRPEFTIIDQNGVNTDLYAGFKSQRNSLAAKMSAIVGSVAVSAKNLFFDR